MSTFNAAFPNWGFNDLLSFSIIIGYKEREKRGNLKFVFFLKATHVIHGHRVQEQEGGGEGIPVTHP